MNYKIENGIAGQIIIFNDGLKQETYFDIPSNILNLIKELQQENQQLKELIDYLKQKQKELKEYVCIYEEKLRNTKKEDYYYNSYLKTIHKFNAQRELIKEILSKIEKGNK